MRTTIRLDDQILSEAKQLAARTGKTLTAVIEDALRQALAGQNYASKRQPVRLPTFSGQGIQPGVDLDDTSALFDLMEAGHDPD